MNDSGIVRLSLSRDESAIREASAQYGLYCRRIAENILGNAEDAEECESEALLAMWNSIPPMIPENLKAYLGKLTRQIAIDKWRSRNAAKRQGSAYALSLEELSEVIPADDLSDAVTADELAGILSDFLKQQPELDRKLFLRRYWYGDSVEETANRFGFGISKVKMRLKRTRDALAKRLKQEGYLI